VGVLPLESLNAMKLLIVLSLPELAVLTAAACMYVYDWLRGAQRYL